MQRSLLRPLLARLSTPLCVAGALTMAGCATSDPALENDDVSGSPGSDTGDDDQSSPAAEAGSAPRTCDVPHFEQSEPPVAFEGLSATVVDQDGELVAGLLSQACGLNVCLQEATDDKGRVTIGANEAISKPAFKYGDGLRYAQLTLLLEGDGVHDLGEQRTLKFPPFEAAEALRAGTEINSSQAILTLADDAEIEVDTLSYPEASQHVFLAQEFDELPQAVEIEDFDGVWAFGPLKTRFCPPAELSLPNSAGLEPGAQVDLYLHVTDIAGHWAPYAEWGKVAAATVSEDGERIVTQPGQGLPELGVVGLRLAGTNAED